MAFHWFLRDGHRKFRDSVGAIFGAVGCELRRSDARATLGDEHDQCQFLFTRVYTLLQQAEAKITDSILCCSKWPDLVLETRYYRSRPRRGREDRRPQLVEAETGADFALALEVDVPGVLVAARSVLGQAKVVDQDGRMFIEEDQLRRLLTVGGPESASYLFWGEDRGPLVVSAQNVESYLRMVSTQQVDSDLLELGLPMAEFFTDAFLGLWFGKDYDPRSEGEAPPKESIPILFHFLHGIVPPPNVVYLGVSAAARYQERRRLRQRPRPGLYAADVVDMGSQ